jgi:hypothetical protein
MIAGNIFNGTKHLLQLPFFPDFVCLPISVANDHLIEFHLIEIVIFQLIEIVVIS